MFKKQKASQHFQEVYNCLIKNQKTFIPMMSNQDLQEFTSIVMRQPVAVRFIITAYRANMIILNAMYNFMMNKYKKNK